MHLRIFALLCSVFAILACSGGIALDDFPRGPIVDVCGVARPVYHRGGEALLSRAYVVGDPCRGTFRIEAAVALTMYAAEKHDWRLLGLVAGTYHEPVALALLGRLHVGGRELPQDYALGWYQMNAALVLADGIRERTGDPSVLTRVTSVTLASLDTYELPEVKRQFDPRAHVAEADAAAAVEVEAYFDLYLTGERPAPSAPVARPAAPAPRPPPARPMPPPRPVERRGHGRR